MFPAGAVGTGEPSYTGSSFIPQSGAIPGLSDLYAGCIGSTQYRILRLFRFGAPPLRCIYHAPPPNPIPNVNNNKKAVFIGSTPLPLAAPTAPVPYGNRAVARDNSFRNRRPPVRC